MIEWAMLEEYFILNMLFEWKTWLLKDNWLQMIKDLKDIALYHGNLRESYERVIISIELVSNIKIDITSFLT